MQMAIGHASELLLRYEMKWKVQWFKVRSKTDSEPA